MACILVTGASGYIGQHVCLAFARMGRLVRGFSRSAQPDIVGKIEWVSGDITDAQAVAQAVKGCEAIVHLACLPLVPSIHDPLEAMRVNVQGTLVLLESARQVGVQQFVFASTGQVCGGQAPLPNAEADLPQPDSPYAASKLSAEVWCQAYTRAFGIPVQILRLFNVYGAAADRRPRPTVEVCFLRQLAQGQRPQVRGNPASGRDFIHVRDVIRAIGLALETTRSGSVINIGTGRLTTLVELAQLSVQVMGQDITPEFIETSEPPARFQADTSKAQEWLGFQAHITLEEGLAELARTM